MLQIANTQQVLKSYLKDEPKPKFINSELQPYYEQTDLTLTHVYNSCLTLKPLKGIDINEQQVQYWYIEFIRMGWKKKDFDKQFEAVKRAMLFNRIDIENWTNTEMMWNSTDFRVKVENAINDRIRNGKLLGEKVIKCNYSDEQKKDILLYESDQIIKRHQREQLEANEDWIKQERIRLKKELIYGGK